MRSFDEMCARAVASLLIIQLAIDPANGNYKEGFGVRDALSQTEMKVYDGSAGQQGPVNVAWEYECCRSVVWAPWLVEDEGLETVSGICDCGKAIKLVSECADTQHRRYPDDARLLLPHTPCMR